MKKILFIIVILLSINVCASGGTLKQSSIIECNGEYYGNHGNPLHWHKAKMVKGNWVTDGEETVIPPCYIKPINSYEEVTFSKCIDGDTAKLIVGGKEKTVRFLAINTPEVASNLKEEEPYGNEARDYTCKMLKEAKKITLEYDSNSDKEDKYGRILAFVYVDDELLEAKLIENGLAKVDYIYGDYAHVDDLRQLESLAKDNNLGMWNNNNADIKNDSVEEKAEENMTISDIIYYIIRIIYTFIAKIFA